MHPKPFCTSCKRHPADIPGYTAEATNYYDALPPISVVLGAETIEDAYAREDGTYNPENGHFLCNECYVKAGMPTSPQGWVAP